MDYSLEFKKIYYVLSVQNTCPYSNIQRYILEGGGGMVKYPPD